MTERNSALRAQQSHTELRGPITEIPEKPGNPAFNPMKPRACGTLEAAVARAVEQAGGVPVVAKALDRSQPTIYGYTDPREPSRMNMEQASVLTRDLHVTAFAEYFSTLAGGVFLPVAAEEDNKAAMLSRLGADAQVLSGDYFATLLRAVADGRIDHQENTALRKRLEPLLCVMALALSKLLDDDRAKTGGVA